MQQTSASGFNEDRQVPGKLRQVRTACPVCQSADRIDKVSNVVRTGRGRVIWSNGEIAHYESELSELLDEPAPPASLSTARALVDLVPPLLAFAAILCVLAILKTQAYIFIPSASIAIATKIAIVWFGVVIPGAFACRYIRARVVLKRELPLWRRARRRWTGLYYCPKDDIVFTRDSYEYVAPSDLHTLLYPGPSVERQPLQDLPQRFLGRGQA